MKNVDSVVVTLDGPSKVGKSHLMATMKTEADFYASSMRKRVDSVKSSGIKPKEIKTITKYVDDGIFNNVVTISAGNGFRAAALYVMLLELKKVPKTMFTAKDYDPLREMLATEGMLNVLQKDPNIGGRVSAIAQMAGAQTLCGALFCDYVTEAYNRDGGSNLVIADARDPVGHLKRNNRIGSATGLIIPESIMPIYVESPAEVAAMREGGDYQAKLAQINERRLLDSMREELPATKPEEFKEDLHDWLSSQFPKPDTPDGIAIPFFLNNHDGVDLGNIQYVASFTAIGAHDLGMLLHSTRLFSQAH
jgi:hypothetical protein